MRLGLIILFSTSISAQVLSVGARGGLPLTDAMAVNASQIIPGPIISSLPSFGTCFECANERTLPYIIGPAVEARLKGAFSLDVEALYSRVDYNHTSASLFGTGPILIANFTATKHIIDRWEFPVLLKYTIHTGHRLRPFADAGISIQYNRERQAEGLAGAASGLVFEPLNVSLMPSESSVVNRSVIEGATVGIGASYGSRRVRPTLEFRYTRWFDKAFTVGSLYSFPGSTAPHTAYSVLNQAQVLLGITF
jgi:hypothetical protein